MIRFFSIVAPGAMGDLPYRYLTALAATGRKVRALPIGPAAAIASERRWYAIAELFTTPMSIPFVNVVCAPLGMMMGVRATAKSLAPVGVLPERYNVVAIDHVVYEPASVFGGMHTTGVRNIAIVIGQLGGRGEPAEISDAHLDDLAKYDVVITSDADASMNLRARLAGRGAPDRRCVDLMPPDLEVLYQAYGGYDVKTRAGLVLHDAEQAVGTRVASYMIARLEDQCFESATSARMDSSPAMDERLAIISQRLLASMASRWKSEHSVISAPPPSPATSTSIASWFRSMARALRRMWRWCTRRRRSSKLSPSPAAERPHAPSR